MLNYICPSCWARRGDRDRATLYARHQSKKKPFREPRPLYRSWAEEPTIYFDIHSDVYYCALVAGLVVVVAVESVHFEGRNISCLPSSNEFSLITHCGNIQNSL